MAKLTYIETFDEANQMMSWLGERREGTIAFDTETSGLQPWKDKIRLAQFGDAETGWALRFDRWSGLVEDIFNNYTGRIAMHNFKFDTQFLIKSDIHPRVNSIDDTRTMAHLIDPHRPTGLKPLCDAYFGPGMSASQKDLSAIIKSNGWDWATIPYDCPEYWQYGALDTVLTARLYDRLEDEMGQHRGLYDVEMSAQIALMNMELRGFKADVAYCKEKSSELAEYVSEVRSWAATEYGDDFNMTSPQQLAEALKADGWTPTEFTPTGKPSVAKGVLEKIDHPLAKAVVSMKHAEKVIKAYFSNIVDNVDDDGYVHASINPLAAITGRMSVSNPALQQIPREALVRNAFTASEGNKLVLIDYDQMELRIAASLSRDVGLMEDIATQEDIHTHAGCKIFGVDQITKQQRQITKNAVYATLFAGGPKVLAETAGISLKEAKEFMWAYNDLYPGLKQFQKQLESRASENRMSNGRVFAQTAFGRIQPCWPDASYKLINYVIQGTGADILKMKIAELVAAGFGEFLVLPVHDEIIFDVPEDIAEDVLRDAKDVMTVDNEECLPVPLTVDGSIVDRWGENYA